MANSSSSGFEKFCGGTFWNTSLTWDTDHPDFTLCFQRTALVWVPCGFLLVMTVPYSHYLSLLPSTQATLSRLSKLKFLMAVLLAILALVNMIKGLVDVTNDGSHSVPVVTIVSPLISLAAFATSAALVRVEWRKGQASSGLQFLFYFMLVIAGIVPIHSYAYQKSLGQEVKDLFRPVLLFISYSFMVIQFLLFCFAEKLPKSKYATDDVDEKRCPETEASFLSRITFWWMNGLILTGYKKSLEESDMWRSNPRDITRNSAPLLEESWKREMIRCGCNPSDSQSSSRRPSIQRTTSVRWNRDTERTPLLSNNGHASREPDVTIEKPKKEPSFLRALTKVFGWTLLKAHALKLICDVLTFVGPILQSALIAFTEDDEQLWKGYFYSAMFFVSSFVYSCFFHQMFHFGMTLGMRVKASVIALVYQKALTMSNEARKKTTVGEIVNLMSVDAQRLQDATGYLWMVWSCPLQIAIAVALLWNLLGISVLAGLIVMVLLIPMNILIVRASRQYQITQMHLKDERIKLMNEVLNGMKVLKLYAWEMSFQEKIKVIRDQELSTLRKFAYLSAAGTFLWTCAPFVVTLATFTAYILSGGILDATKAFTALSLFNILRFPMNMLPGMVNYLVTANVSIKRLGKFLQNKDIDSRNVLRLPAGGGSTEAITITNGTFAWGSTEVDAPVLNNISLNVNSGSLTAVVGQVGAGKSSLLSAMLGEMEKLDGKVSIRGSVAYIAQQAWIQNATLRDNVLFGQPYDEERYNMVLDACALRPDLQILPAGDMTEIGEKGINLSGGQKQRVSLARAVYQDSDIYLLDDPLSAVDAHVGKHIFDQVISSSTGLLKHKTRVLVTHGIHWLPKVDNIAVLVNGSISESGSYEGLLSHNKAFAQFLKTYLNQEESDDDEDDAELHNMKSEILQRVLSVTADDQDNVDQQQAKRSAVSPRSRTNSKTISDSGSTHEKKIPGRQTSGSVRDAAHRQASKHESAVGTKAEKGTKVDKTKIIQEETSATGEVKLSVYWSYLKSIGLWLAFFTMTSFILYQASSIGSSVWLSRWTEDSYLKNTTNANTTKYTNTQYFYLGIYGGFGVAQAAFILIYALVFSLTNVRSSAVLHTAMLTNILRSPMMFFETTPVGRILNRFSRDIETIDNVLPNLIRSWMNTFFSAISTIIIISYSTPIFLSVVVPLFVIYILVQRFYIPTSRQLKRIESTTRSPIYVHFSETITGSSTIRGFQRQEQFVHHSEKLVDHNQVFYFATICSNRWLGFRLEILGSLVVFAAAMFAVQGRGNISAGIVGLSISYALQITQALNWMVRMSTDLETNIVSVERVNEYSNTPTEADWHVGAVKPPSSWPSNGKISFDNYATRYRPGLDLVLRNIKVNIRGGEKIGIVGRTGAGKSSMTLALFRLIEAAHGSIAIDDVKISDIALYPLRSKLVILPQDPVLFSGTLRMNLDPFSIYSDDRIWQALEHAHLKDYVSTLPAGLDHECGEGGHNLSVGQRQLVCLARAILRKTKILVLDEATAAVDLETDELIQKTIQEEFAECTVLTIAHRINTIMDSDRVMVLDTGAIREFDTPSQLLANKGSLFYALAKDAGLVKD